MFSQRNFALTQPDMEGKGGGRYFNLKQKPKYLLVEKRRIRNLLAGYVTIFKIRLGKKPTKSMPCNYCLQEFAPYSNINCLKVSKSRKQILKFSLEPKNEPKYFCISALPLKLVESMKYKYLLY